MLSRRQAMSLLATAPWYASGCRPGPSQRDAQPVASNSCPGLTKAVQWLWSKQAKDGGWHSDQYSMLESGQALTPFVFDAILRSRTKARDVNAKRALQFIRRSVGPDGSVGLNVPEAPEYPNYATAHAIKCLAWTGSSQDRQRIHRMAERLIEAQYSESNGFGPETLAYGGWGFGGQLPLGGSPGHMDLHHTRCVLQSLQIAGLNQRATIQRALAFLLLMQRHPNVLNHRPAHREACSFAAWDGPFDGGFYFSPVVLAANKGGMRDNGTSAYFGSYATCTCDGILALLACGVALDDERTRAAIRWLDRHPSLEWPGGVPHDLSENWGQSILFTHLASRAEVMREIDAPDVDRRKLRNHVLRLQKRDGSFCNDDGFLMKEDDPILCTALAVLALSATHTSNT